jgi:hypothetical protein
MPYRIWGVVVAVVGLVLWQVPHRWCARHFDTFFGDDLGAPRLLARGVALESHDLKQGDFATGNARFDGEWLFGSSMMAAMGHGQLAERDRERRAEHLANMDLCIDHLTSPAATAFDRAAWGHEPLDDLQSQRGHVAYLGYLNLALGLRRVHGDKHAAIHDRITAALERRFAKRLLVETYPGETYPVDNAAAIASIALGAEATGRPRPPIVDQWVQHVRQTQVDQQTGLLAQRVGTGPRGSGTALASYFLGYGDVAFSRELYEAAQQHLGDSVLGFGTLREYPSGAYGAGDIDSGPLVFGHSISATGFSLGPARMHGDADGFASRYATSHLFGAPRSDGDRSTFVSGGPLGNAILFAMLTAPRLDK